MAKALLVVRAVVADAADRGRFDRWYATEFLPDAVQGFGVARAWRCWSHTNPAIHYAFYEFPSVAEVHRAQQSDAIGELVAEFDRAWPKVTRTREVLEVAGGIGSTSR